MSIRNKIQELKRELILEEAGKLFIEAGYTNMKVADLAKRVGVSVGTIYSLFDSKENLYNHYVISQIEHYRVLVEQELRRHEDPVAKLRELGRIKLEAFLKHQNAFKESVVNDPTLFKKIASKRDDPMLKLYRFIADEVMRPLSATLPGRWDPMEMAFLFEGVSNGIVKYTVTAGGDLNARLEELIDYFLRIVKEPK